jgi:hypothetical protein
MNPKESRPRRATLAALPLCLALAACAPLPPQPAPAADLVPASYPGQAPSAAARDR